MKKTLIYITLSGILATIVLRIQSIIMPYVFAASETAGVKAKLDLLSDCTWSDGEGSALTVETGKLCEINGTGKTATTVTVQTGGTLLVGNFLTTDFTVTGTASYNTTIYGIMNNAGTFATTGGGVLVDGGTLTSSNAMSIGGSGNAKDRKSVV